MNLTKEEQIVYDAFKYQKEEELYSKYGETYVNNICESLCRKGKMKKTTICNTIGGGTGYKYKIIID